MEFYGTAVVLVGGFAPLIVTWPGNIYPVRLSRDRLCKFVRFAARGCAIWLDGDLPRTHKLAERPSAPLSRVAPCRI